MSGYKNGSVRLDFPELTDDDPVFVVIRNPRHLPLSFWDNDLDESAPAYQEPALAGESPEDAQARMDRNHARMVSRDRSNAEKMTKASMTNYAKLITDSHVYAGDNEELLTGTLTAKQVLRLPQLILTRVANTIQESVGTPA